MSSHMDVPNRRLTSAVGMLVLFLVSVTACVSQLPPSRTSTPTQSTGPIIASVTKESPPKDWTSRWLRGIPCQPPCWEGITPGKTTADEATGLLQKSSLIANVSITTSLMAPYDKLIIWNWADNSKGGSTLAHAQTSDKDYIRDIP